MGSTLGALALKKQQKDLIEEVHELVCGTTRPVNLYRRLQRQGDYWPDMAKGYKSSRRGLSKMHMDAR
jgi:hypothetical protein